MGAVVGFPFNLSSHSLKIYDLAVNSLITFAVTSMTIYVQPPRVFFMDRISPMNTLR